MTLPVSGLIDVDILVEPTAPTRAGFGIGLVLGVSTVLPTEERIKHYVSLADVGTDFGDTTAEYLAAQSYFMQSPAPDEIMIGRAFPSGAAGHLNGGPASATVADYVGVTDGGFDITVDGTLCKIAGLNFSALSTMNAIAAAIEAALDAELTDTTCTWDGAKFLITSPTLGAASAVTFASAPTDAGNPDDIKALLCLTAATYATTWAGLAVESITQSLALSLLFDPDFYGVSLWSGATDDNIKHAMIWTEANGRLYFYTTDDPNCLLSNVSSDLGSYALAQGFSRSFGQYSTKNANAALSAMARELIVDFDSPNSTITIMFKQEPGVAAEGLTPANVITLDAKNLNYYDSRGGYSMIATGKTGAGRWLDEVHGLDWLQDAVQTNVFTALATTPTKIPQTDAGVAVLVQAITKALNQGVANGLLAAGVWNGANLGEVKSGDFLPNGYYIYATPVALQSTADRAARKSPPITAIMIGAGAIQSASITMTFQR